MTTFLIISSIFNVILVVLVVTGLIKGRKFQKVLAEENVMQATQEDELLDIEPLAGDVIADRVIDQESAKIFSVKADVFFLDDEYQNVRAVNFTGCKPCYSNPIPVKNNAGQLIGHATLSENGKIITAEIFLDYSTPERLMLETKCQPLYPVLQSHSKVVDINRAMYAISLEITGILISFQKDVDPRVSFNCL